MHLILQLNLPEDEGEGLGFRLTRTLWDPYPWVGMNITEIVTVTLPHLLTTKLPN